MKITVKDQVVKHNLELLKDLLQRAKKGKCKAWIETTTGEISDEPPTGGPKKTGAWKAVQIRLNLSPLDAETVLVISEDTKAGDKLFHFEGWTVKARHAVLETLRVINTKLAKTPQGEERDAFLANFASLQISLMAHRKEKREREWIEEAWHDLDREGAEQALNGQPIGTYLFRRDIFATLLEDTLKSRFGKSPYCITLTYLDEAGIVRDKTLVYKDKHFLVYNDDPQLLETRYTSVMDAIHSIDPCIALPMKSKLRKAG